MEFTIKNDAYSEGGKGGGCRIESLGRAYIIGFC